MFFFFFNISRDGGIVNDTRISCDDVLIEVSLRLSRVCREDRVWILSDGSGLLLVLEMVTMV